MSVLKSFMKSLMTKNVDMSLRHVDSNNIMLTISTDNNFKIIATHEKNQPKIVVSWLLPEDSSHDQLKQELTELGLDFESLDQNAIHTTTESIVKTYMSALFEDMLAPKESLFNECTIDNFVGVAKAYLNTPNEGGPAAEILEKYMHAVQDLQFKRGDSPDSPDSSDSSDSS